MKPLAKYAFLAFTLLYLLPAQGRLDDYPVLAYHKQGTDLVAIRYLDNGTWTNVADIDISSIGVGGATEVLGVGFAHPSGSSPLSLLGVTRGKQLAVYTGLGLLFDASPVDKLQTVASAPSICHWRGTEWLVGFTRENGTFAIQLLDGRTGGGFAGTDISIGGITNSNVTGRPSLACNGSEVLVAWQTTSPKQYRFAVGTLNNGGTTIAVRDTGTFPTGPASYVPEVQADPAVVYVDSNTYFAALVKRSGTSGLTHDAAFIYRSDTSGSTWTAPGQTGIPTLLTGLTNISLGVAGTSAAPRKLVLAVVSYEGHPNWSPYGASLFESSDGTSWTEVPGAVNSVASNPASPIVAGHRYLAPDPDNGGSISLIGVLLLLMFAIYRQRASAR